MPLKNPVDTYKNLGVPRYGETEVRQQSTADIWTLTHSSANAGKFLVGRDFLAEGSTLQTSDLWYIDADGAFVSQRAGGAVETASSASTALTLASSQLGKFLIVNGQSSGVKVILPAPEVGMQITVFQSTGHSSHALQISRDSSATDIIFAGGGGNNSTTPTTAAFARPATTKVGAVATFTAVSTVRWLCVPGMNGIDGTSATAELGGSWVAVSS